MTNTNKVNTTSVVDRSLLRAAGAGIAAALTPLAVVIGIAAMNFPAAEAYTTTSYYQIGNMVRCSSY